MGVEPKESLVYFLWLVLKAVCPLPRRIRAKTLTTVSDSFSIEPGKNKIT